jgi:tetratricopeptide (TPR) repeat protein
MTIPQASKIIAGRFILLLLLLLLVCPEHKTQTRNADLVSLQRAYAMGYLEPEPHMALAKYYFEHGNRIEAFWIVEAARRGRFEEKIFDPAFYRAFDGFDNSKPAEARLLAEYARNPDSIETIDGLADIYISRDDWPNAKRYLLAAIQKKADDYRFTAGLAMVFQREGKPREADQLQEDYIRKFPNTAAGYGIRAWKLIEKSLSRPNLSSRKGSKRFPTTDSCSLILVFFTRVRINKKQRKFLLGLPNSRQSRNKSKPGSEDFSSESNPITSVRSIII